MLMLTYEVKLSDSTTAAAGGRTAAAVVGAGDSAGGAGRGDVSTAAGATGAGAGSDDVVGITVLILDVVAAGVTSTGFEEEARFAAGAGSVAGSAAGGDTSAVAVVIAGAVTCFSRVISGFGASACVEIAASMAGGEIGITLIAARLGTIEVVAAAAFPTAAAGLTGTPTAPLGCITTGSPTPDMVRVSRFDCCLLSLFEGIE
jgi:hypothetical protein